MKQITRTLLKLMLLTIMTPFVTYAGGNENECEPTVVVHTKIKVVDRVVEKQVEVIKNVTKKNRLSLLLLNGPSNDVSTSTTLTGTTVRHEDDNALGLQYMRDIGRFNVLIQGDTNKNIGVGLGIRW